MARTERRRGDIQAKFREGVEARGRRQNRAEHTEFMETLGLVCKYFCQGCTVAEIVRQAKEERNITLTREKPYEYLSYAASHGMLTYRAPLAEGLRLDIRNMCPSLGDVDVVLTSVFDDVAENGTDMLMRLLRNVCNEKREKKREADAAKAASGKTEAPKPSPRRRHKYREPGAVPEEETAYVGFAGGRALRKVAQSLAKRLREPIEIDMPHLLSLHSLVAGFDIHDPTTDPTTFATYFLGDPSLRVLTKFTGLFAPAVVERQNKERTMNMAAIQAAFAAAKKLDIIITSAGCWTDEDSGLHRYMTAKKSAAAILDKEHCVGDMLWQPLSNDGPIERSTSISALTLMELTKLGAFIAKGGKVLLVLGPCGGCGAPKTDILRAILTMQPCLITHLVVDTLSARPLQAVLQE